MSTNLYMILLLVSLLIVSNTVCDLLTWFIEWLRLKVVYLCVSHYNCKVCRKIFFYMSAVDEWDRLQYGLNYLEIRRKFKL